MNLDDPHDRTAAAGEWVLGILAQEDRDSFEPAMQADATLRAEVYAWQDRLFNLSRTVRPVEPSAHLWGRIEGGLDTVPRSGPTMSLRSDVSAANTAPRRQLRVWQSISGLAIAASVILATVLLLRSPLQPVPDRYVAVLQSPDRVNGWVVEVVAGERVRLVPVADTAPPPPGKALQFWTKPDGAAGPTSLGLVKPGEVTELPIARLPAVGEKQLFELTLEPETGSPIDRPTGPILFVGRTVRL